MGTSDVLRLSGVGKRYGRSRWILRDIDAAVPAGAIVRISGTNGAGKSTLLRLAVGACRPSAGTVRSPGRGTRYVPDRTVVSARVPAASYLAHMGALQGLSRRAARDRSGVLLERLGLASDARSEVGRLSKGSARKVMLAQALLTPPALLVLDEPWSGLDDRTQAVLVTLLDETAADGGAVLFTDHRESVVLVRATASYRIVDGRLVGEDVQPGARTGPVDGGMQIELAMPAGSGRDVTDWGAVAGVQSSRVHGAGVRLSVRPGSVEAVLAHALDESWSVTAVRRGEG